MMGKVLRALARTGSIAGAGLAIAAASAAMAQEAVPDREDAGNPEIIVTAQRRAENVQDIPASISVISGAALSSGGVVRFQDLGNSVIGVQIARTGSLTQPSIRGVSTLIAGAAFENNVAVYVDGFYQADTKVINADLANLQSIEVLKGPQGTLYGRNATGGAILINTLNPSEAFVAKFSLGYGNRDDKTGSAYLSGPIAAGLSASVVGYWRENDGYIKDVSGFDAAPFDNRMLRTKLRFHPNEDVDVVVGYNYLYLDDPRGQTYTIFDNFPAGFVGTSERDKVSINFPGRNLVETDEVTLTAKFRLPVGELAWRTGYSHTDVTSVYDFDGQKAHILETVSPQGQTFWQHSADLNIDSIDGISLVLGGLYFTSDLKVLGLGYGPTGLNSESLFYAKTEAYSVFADGSIDLADGLVINGGVRYSHESKRIRFETTRGVLTNTLLPWRRKTFSEVTPRLSIRYEVANGANIYASYSKGFKSGTFPSSAVDPSLALPVDQEIVNGYEAGVKLSRGNWRWNSAIYYYDYSNLQVSTTQLVAGQLIQALGNAKAAEIYGAETELNGRLNDRLDISVGLAYNHARYTDIDNAVGTGVNPATNRNVTAIQDWSGKRMVRAPGWTANARINYNFPVLGGSMLVTSALFYTSKYISNNPSTFFVPGGVNNNTDQRWIVPGYALVNLQAAWTAPGDHLTVTGYVNNVTDKRFPITTAGSALGSYRQWNEPRAYGIRLGYEF